MDFGNGVPNEVLQEYLALYYQAQEKVDVYDKRIEELSRSEKYREPVEKLGWGSISSMILLLRVKIGNIWMMEEAGHEGV